MNAPRSAAPAAAPRLWDLAAEFETVEQLIVAAGRVRDAGSTRWDAHTPFPVHGLNDAMGLRMTRLPWLTLACGALGAATGLVLQYWTNAVDYPVIVSGKPFLGLPANIPVIFELTILFAALGTFIGKFAANGLPMLHHPVFGRPRLRRLTSDRFYIVRRRQPGMARAARRSTRCRASRRRTRLRAQPLLRQWSVPGPARRWMN